MKVVDVLKSGALVIFSAPYFGAAYYVGHGALDLSRFGDAAAAGLLGGLAVLLTAAGLGSLAAARWPHRAPDYLVTLHAVVAIMFVVISMQA